MQLTAPPMPPGVTSGKPCPRYDNGQIKRLAPTMGTRRELAVRYGAMPGAIVTAPCQYCPHIGLIEWVNLASGKPGSVVRFIGLTMDHVIPYSRGGAIDDVDNLVLACKPCNSSKNANLNWTGRST